MQNQNTEEVVYIEQVDYRGNQEVVVVTEQTNRPAEVVIIQEPAPYQQNPYQQNPYGPQVQYGQQQQYQQQPQQGYQQQSYQNQYVQYPPGQQPVMVQMGTPTPLEIVQVTAPLPNYSSCRYPIDIQCPYCKQVGRTRCEKVPVGKTYAWCCCLLIFFWPCMCVPFCTDECLGVKSYCSFCSHEVGFIE